MSQLYYPVRYSAVPIKTNMDSNKSLVPLCRKTTNKACIIKDSDVHKAVALALEPFQSVTEKGAKPYPWNLIKPNLCGGVPGNPALIPA